MKLKAHINHMSKCRDLFSEHAQYALFSKALVYLIDELDFFEKYIHDSNPFKKHFHTRFQEPVEQEEDCFALHEDIVIFFREKALRLGLHNLDDIELEVLADFEAKEHAQDSFVAKWYFEKLPLILFHELSESVKGISSTENSYDHWIDSSR